MRQQTTLRIAGLMLIAAMASTACGSSDASTLDDPTLQPTASTTVPTSTRRPTSTAPPAATSPTTSPTVTEAPSTTLASALPVGAEPTEAAFPPPAAFAEVEDDYRQSVDSILAEGRAVADQLLANELEPIHARLDAALAARLSVGDMKQVVAELLASAPLTLGADRAIQLDPAMQAYVMALNWGDRTAELSLRFNPAGEIVEILLEPKPAVPPDPTAGSQSDVTFRLPFEGLWFVFWGGDTTLDNYHVELAMQRHAYDILVWKDGATHSGDGSLNADYWAYGQQVLAPAAGTIVAVGDGLPDQVPQVGSDTMNPVGNHVVIKVADGEYLVIAHLQPGSLMVAEGDVVETGQPMALVGNSGNTSEPHIHMHLQDTPDFRPTTIGLPLVFSDYTSNGQAVDRGRPLADQFIANSPQGSTR